MVKLTLMALVAAALPAAKEATAAGAGTGASATSVAVQAPSAAEPTAIEGEDAQQTSRSGATRHETPDERSHHSAPSLFGATLLASRSSEAAFDPAPVPENSPDEGNSITSASRPSADALATPSERLSTTPYSARLSGDVQVVQAVTAALRARGVSVNDSDDASSVAAHIERAGDALSIRLVSADGRVIARQAPGASEAATFVESWVREDLLQPLLVRAIARRPLAPLRASAAAVATVEQDLERRAPRAFLVGAHAVLGAAADGSTWSGVHGGVCVRIGQFCVGARGQYAVVLGQTAGVEAQRTDLSFLAAVELDFELGPVELAPAIAVGYGRVTSGQHLAIGEAEEDAGGVRARIELAARHRFSDACSVRVMGALEGTPGADRLIFDDVENGGPQHVPLPGENVWVAWLGLGLEVGAP